MSVLKSFVVALQFLATVASASSVVSVPASVIADPHPCLAQSHVMSFLKMGTAILERGHTFTLILSQVDTDVATKAGLDANGMEVLTYPSLHSRKECVELAGEMAAVDPLSAVLKYVNVGLQYCNELISDEALWTALQPFIEQANVFLGDLTWPCTWLFAEKVNNNSSKAVNNLLFSGTMVDGPTGEHLGLPSPASEVPGMGLWKTMLSHEPMPFGHRLLNLAFREFSRHLVSLTMLRPYNAIRQKSGLEPARVVDAIHRTPILVLVPLVWGVEPPRALPPNWKPIHPVLPGPSQPLPANIASWIDAQCSGREGLVLVSFGTQVTLSKALVDKIFAALSLLSDEFCFIWQLPAGVHRPHGLSTQEHILPLEWLPQNDLLGHAQTVAFISHLGYGSLYEAAFHGVPLVCVPMFGDQEDNASKVVYREWGVLLNKATFTDEEMAHAVRKVGKEGSTMRSRAAAIAALVKTGSGTRDVVNWVEYAAAHGLDHLMPFHSMRASYMAYYNLDVGLFALCLILTMSYGTYLCMKRWMRRNCNQKRSLKLKTN